MKSPRRSWLKVHVFRHVAGEAEGTLAILGLTTIVVAVVVAIIVAL